MPKTANNRTLATSQKIYERLLLAYPKAHREKFGPAMAQLFHDQCRDAWNEAHSLGVIKLWLRVLPDLVKTSIIERLAAFNERKSMTDKINSLTPPRAIFWKVFAVFFLLVLCYSVAVAFLLPETYASTARILVEKDQSMNKGFYDPYFLQTTFEVIESSTVLEPVIDKLKLNVDWGKKYLNGQTLPIDKTMEIFRQRLQLAPVRNTKLISITFFSDDKNEAAQIANAIAESYRDYRIKSSNWTSLLPQPTLVQIIDLAEPGHAPVRPNKPLNIAVGAIAGIFLALIVGGIAVLITFFFRKRIRQTPATT